MKRTLLLGLALLMVLAACNMGNVGVERNESGGIDISVTLTESEVNTLISEAISQAQANGQAVRAQNVSVDLQNGQIVINGEYEQQNGTGNFVPGSITLAVTTVDGRANVTVTSADIAGIEANDARLTAITDRINEALNSRASRDNGPNVTLTNISITDNDMTMTISIQQ
jgi:hypothetical protein